MSGLADSPNYSPTPFNLPVVISALVITVVFTMLMLAFYICSAFHHSSRLGLDANLDNTIQLGPLERLDESVLKSLPVFVYSKSKDSKGGPLECAICLSEFEEEEKGRKLNCGHSFHVGCIDMWFDSHSNCPVCRFKVDSKEAGADHLNGVEAGSRSSHSITIHIQDLAAISASESFKLEASPSALRDLRRFLSSSRRTSVSVPEDPPHV